MGAGVKYTKKTRDAAAHICACMASNISNAGMSVDSDHSVETLESDLARSAFWFVGRERENMDDLRPWWAEAEALLRCGWSPS